jgi:hypothetical protein
MIPTGSDPGSFKSARLVEQKNPGPARAAAICSGVRFLLLFVALVPGAFAANDLLLVNGTVIPAPDQPALRDTAILVHEGRIAAVGPRDQLAIPAGTEIMDCTGRFITAGFWNCHVHLTQPARATYRSRNSRGR